jgi:hypothetical protein
MEETPISRTWTPIKLDEELVGERAPRRTSCASTSAGSRWCCSPSRPTPAPKPTTGATSTRSCAGGQNSGRPRSAPPPGALEASRSDIEQYAAWLAAVDPAARPAAGFTECRLVAGSGLAPNTGSARHWPRSQFETLRANGILDRRYRVYRASHIALYSSFRIDDPADPSTDKRLGRSTDIKRESR